MFAAPELNHATAILDSLVVIHPPLPKTHAPVDFAQKLDRLYDLIDTLRYHHGIVKRRTTRDVFLPDSVFADPGSRVLHFRREGLCERTSSHRRPSALVLPLLSFLHERPGHGRRVLGIIRDFIQRRLDLFGIVDFARTATGVVRAETSVRGAARILRGAGLLQFTRNERYKTWRLSLLGILAAACPPGQVVCPFAQGCHDFWRHAFLSRLAPLTSMPALVTRLETATKTLDLKWEKAEAFLTLTMVTLKRYQQTIATSARELTERQKLAAIEALLLKLNAAPEAQAIVAAFDNRQVTTTRSAPHA